MKAKSGGPGRPKAPKSLCPEAVLWWDRILEEYDLSGSCLLVLEHALECLGRMRQAQEAITKHGMILGSKGMSRVNPACKVEIDCKRTMLAYLKELHLDLEPLNDGPGRPPGR